MNQEQSTNKNTNIPNNKKNNDPNNKKNNDPNNKKNNSKISFSDIKRHFLECKFFVVNSYNDFFDNLKKYSENKKELQLLIWYNDIMRLSLEQKSEMVVNLHDLEKASKTFENFIEKDLCKTIRNRIINLEKNMVNYRKNKEHIHHEDLEQMYEYEDERASFNYLEHEQYKNHLLQQQFANKKITDRDLKVSSIHEDRSFNQRKIRLLEEKVKKEIENICNDKENLKQEFIEHYEKKQAVIKKETFSSFKILIFLCAIVGTLFFFISKIFLKITSKIFGSSTTKKEN